MACQRALNSLDNKTSLAETFDQKLFGDKVFDSVEVQTTSARPPELWDRLKVNADALEDLQFN